MVGPAPELSNALGANVPNINNTDMKSYGWELEIGWRDQIGDLSYGVKAVLSDDQQKVTNYPNPTNTLTASWYNGEVLGEIWGYKTIGIANSQEEMDKHLASLPNGGQSSLGSGWGAGDIMYADINNDGVVNKGNNRVGDSGDYQVIGNSTPRYKFGVTLDAAYKGWDFRVFLQGVAPPLPHLAKLISSFRV